MNFLVLQNSMPIDWMNGKNASMHSMGCDNSVDSSGTLPPTVTVNDVVGDGMSIPPVDYEWRNIHSYSSLYRPDVFPFVTTLPTGRYGFMTPPVHFGAASSAIGCRQAPRAASTLLLSPTESSLNSLELEAIAAVHELQFVVKDIFVSELLPRTSELIFLNVTTLEGQAFCIELTVKGWRVTSLRHDCMNGDYCRLDLHTRYFETLYSLMDNISAGYRRKFSEALCNKLQELVDASHALENENDEKAPADPMSPSFRRDKNVRFSIAGEDKES